MGVNVEISGRENSKELLRPESMVKSLAFGQARWADPLKDFEDRTVWLAKWEMSVDTGVIKHDRYRLLIMAQGNRHMRVAIDNLLMSDGAF